MERSVVRSNLHMPYNTRFYQASRTYLLDDQTPEAVSNKYDRASCLGHQPQVRGHPNKSFSAAYLILESPFASGIAEKILRKTENTTLARKRRRVRHRRIVAPRHDSYMWKVLVKQISRPADRTFAPRLDGVSPQAMHKDHIRDNRSLPFAKDSQALLFCVAGHRIDDKARSRRRNLKEMKRGKTWSGG